MVERSTDQPIQILKFNGTTQLFELLPEFEKILTSDDIKDCSISIISIAGSLRRGKSFLLNFFLRYLYAEYVENDSENWIGNNYVPLEGFKWRGGTKVETTGIWVWSKIFKKTLSNGENVCVMLVDTQGVFDEYSNMKDNVTLFSLSTLLSSVQIYNIFNQIQEDDLQNLQLFSEFSKIAMHESSNKPFQNLLFLVRDWYNQQEYALGAKGGHTYLKEKLKISATQKKQLYNIREYLNSYFEQLDCFLMPHPGKKVAESNFYGFKGDLKDIDEDFIKILKELVPKLLNPENILLKKINGHKIIAKEMLHYAECYLNNLNCDNITPQTIYEANVSACSSLAINSAIDFYNQKMKKYVNEYTKFIKHKDLN